jgi:hypothetical protein
VNADERDEIAASVAAHAELGPRYETAVAEGLVERIGEEIDKRVDARLRGMGQQPLPRQAYPPSPGHQIVPPGYHGEQAAAHAAAPKPAPPASPPEPARRSNGVTGMFLGLGSMGLGVGATAVVVSHNVASGAEVIIVLLIWLFITVINVAHSQRR